MKPFSHVLSKASLSRSDTIPRPVLPEAIVWSYEPGKMLAAALKYLTSPANSAKNTQRLDAGFTDDEPKLKTGRLQLD